MLTSLQSPYANVLPFLSGIPSKYWKSGVVPWGSILTVGSPAVDTEYLYLMAYNPSPGTVSYTPDAGYPQFSESALGVSYRGQCVALAKAIADKRETPTSQWKPFQSLTDFIATPESHLPSLYQGMMIACFDGKPNYALAAANRKHVAILLDITRDSSGKPKSITVVDQNYYNYAPYAQYAGKIARHVIPWGTATQKWVAFARNYHIVGI